MQAGGWGVGVGVVGELGGVVGEVGEVVKVHKVVTVRKWPL